MFFFRKPSAASIDRFLAAQQQTEFSYADIGATRSLLPSGYTVDHNRIRLGSGAQTFDLAVAALRRWQMFAIGWVTLCWPNAPIVVGTQVGVLARHFGFWSLHACRIVYLLDEEGSVRRYGFAYGTLDEHAESGEERFSIEWHQEDDSVWYDLLAFSRPHHWLARAGYPITRALQRKFAADSKTAMRLAAGTQENH